LKKDRIIQFVGFITVLDSASFLPKWKEYVRLLGPGHVNPELMEQEPEGKNRFRFISKHEWPDESFDFITKNGKRTEHFPELNVRAIHAGGYVALSDNPRNRSEAGELRLIAFISHNENDLSYYRELAPAANLSVYQAYYESCSHGYILEFVLSAHLIPELTAKLKARPGTEICVCRTCGKLQTA